jgi:protein arginine N-methyltransferase 1
MDERFVTPGYDDFPLNLHRAMLDDKLRLRSFRQAIQAHVKPGDVVVDVGTGTGVLAFMAHLAGAARVLAFDRSAIVRTAERVRDLNFPDAPIEFYELDALTERLPRVKADVLICELIGNFGLEENIIPVIRRVRTQLLRPGGCIVPGQMELLFAPVQSRVVHAEMEAWTKPIGGVDYTPFQDVAYNRVYHVDGERLTLLGKPDVLLAIDFATVVERPRRIAGRFPIDRAGTLHGIGSWFRASLSPGNVLQSDPRTAATHWGQIFFPIGEPVRVVPGAVVELELSMTRGREAHIYKWEGAIYAQPRDREPLRFAREARDLLY